MHRRVALLLALLALTALGAAPTPASAQQPDAGAAKDAGIDKDAAMAADRDAAADKDAAEPPSPWGEEARTKAREGTALLQKKQYDEAEKLFTEVLATAPDYEEVILNYAVLLERTKRPEKAVEILEAYHTRKPDAVQPYFYLSGLAQRQKNDARALSLMEEAAGKFPDNVDIQLRLARLYKDDDARAMAAYKRAIELDPKSSMALNNLGTLYMRANRYTEAAAILNDYIEKYPTVANGRFNLAVTYVALGRYDDATKIYEGLAERRPGDPFAVGGLCVTHVLAGKPDKADALLQPILAKGEPKAQFAYCAGLRHLFAGDLAKATPFLKTASEGNEQTYHVAAYAEALRQGKQLDEADSLMQAHIKKLSSARAVLLPVQALVAFDRGKKEDAKVLLEQAIAAQPEYKGIDSFVSLTRLSPQGIATLKTLSAPAPPKASSGCGCRTTEGSSSNAFILALGLLGLWFVGRRAAR